MFGLKHDFVKLRMFKKYEKSPLTFKAKIARLLYQNLISLKINS